MRRPSGWKNKAVELFDEASRRFAGKSIGFRLQIAADDLNNWFGDEFDFDAADITEALAQAKGTEA